MRELKFRGLQHGEFVYGEFVYASLVNDFFNGKIINSYIYKLVDYDKTFCVDSNSIGQFTGLRDKNGKEVIGNIHQNPELLK